MKRGPLAWLVAFFTRPIRPADVSAVLRSLKPRLKARPRAPSAAPDDDRERTARPRPSPAGGARAPAAPIRDNTFDVAVSEQPLDTLPAELQSEFGLTSRPAPLAPPGDKDAPG
jgi:hypothetical protein